MSYAGCDPNLPGIRGWFPLENREVLEELIDCFGIRSVIEIGCFLGLSTAWFAKRVEKVTCVDRWFEPATEPNTNNLVDKVQAHIIPQDFYSLFEEGMRSVGVWDKLEIIRGDSSKVADRVGEADLVYIDGDHTLIGCLSDIGFYAPKARKVVCGDDYLVHPGFGVMDAVCLYYPAHFAKSPFWWAIK